MSQNIMQEITLLLRSGWRLLALETFEEDRALKVLDRAASACERSMRVWSVAGGLSEAAGQGAGSLDQGLIAMAEVQEPSVFVLLDPQGELSDHRTVRRLRDWLPKLSKRKQTVVLLGPIIELPLELAREGSHIELPLPRADVLDSLFRRFIDPGDDSAQIAALDSAVAAALGLTATEAVRVLRKACTLAGGLNAEAVGHIVGEKRRALRRSACLAFHDSDDSLDQVGGLGELKRWLRDRRRAFDEEARKFDLPIPRGLLMLGVQGCGKSLCAKAVALEWQFPLLRLDLAAVFSGTEASPEAAIREATAIAESIAPAVLWIDEIEKGFTASSSDVHATRVFGSFLTWLSEKKSPVFVVATANDVANLPPELLRRGRFDELFFVDLPTQAERAEILSIHLLKRGRDPKQFQIDGLALEAERLSGAELEQVISTALYSAYSEDRDLSDNDIANAIHDTVPLYDTYEDQIKELRDWARNRARLASVDAKMADLFQSR